MSFSIKLGLTKIKSRFQDLKEIRTLNIPYTIVDAMSPLKGHQNTDDVEVAAFIDEKHFLTNEHDLFTEGGSFNIPITELENSNKVHLVAMQGPERANAVIDLSKRDIGGERGR